MTVKPEISSAEAAEANKYLDEKWKLVPSFLKVRGLVKQHLDSFNYFIDHEIKEIVASNRRITCEEDTNWFMEFKVRE